VRRKKAHKAQGDIRDENLRSGAVGLSLHGCGRAHRATFHTMIKAKAGELVIDRPPNAPDLSALESGQPMPHYGPRS
jgi:hypothetical protein